MSDAGPQGGMTDLLCPLCEQELRFPGGRQEAQDFMAVLADHFGNACQAITSLPPISTKHKAQ